MRVSPSPQNARMSYELESSFEAEVIQASATIPVLVDFWAPWCGPCQALGPVLEKMAGTAGERWRLIKVNTEAHPAVAQEYQIASIPAVKLFVDGKVVDEFNGALSESQIETWLENALPSAAAKSVAEARELMSQQREPEAKKIVEAVLNDNPHNEDALLLQAELAFPNDPKKSLDIIESIKVGSDNHERAQALKVLSEHRLRANTRVELPESQGKEAYLQAIDALASLNYEEALDQLILSIESDRQFSDEAAIELGKGIFRWLGIRHPIADNFYRKFTSVIYA